MFMRDARKQGYSGLVPQHNKHQCREEGAGRGRVVTGIDCDILCNEGERIKEDHGVFQLMIYVAVLQLQVCDMKDVILIF